MMTNDELRALVREIVAERLGAVTGLSAPQPADNHPRHASHLLLHVVPGAESGGACLIEPAVNCNFCGYCQSLGH
jgi:hypothetical protein